MVTNEMLLQLEDHLKCSEFNWLLGAGISYDANLPLMYPLTNKVKKEIKELNKEVYDDILVPLINELPENSHIEHLLSHLGDYAALAERNREKKAYINGVAIELADLENAHYLIISSISKTIKSGYVEDENGNTKIEGTPSAPIVCIASHRNFIDALFNYSSAGIFERRKPINLFTTNYDTLIEDALALQRVSYWDGFSGGAVAHRTLKYGDNLPLSGYRAHLIKMHGSIDWYLCEKGYVWRVRDNDTYPNTARRVLIYPQATKYIATQQDPFSTQFDLFRKTLNSENSNVLAICGYSFGDDHINNEIEFALNKEANKTVIVAFVECSTEIPECLNRWRSREYGRRVLIVSSKGLYVGNDTPIKRKEGDDFWWTFDGMTSILKNGCEV
ncbi:SIR2 family protein [Pseudoalteromonas sp. SWN29]|uniref:SIR2 family protein n=1 Tax=Pseudoalteromonas sp. SWN29 TaxID=2792064 RepID=UPI0018CEAC99|nr:SIR2 family protein [Pseudoalteromonas sp. SWN29]MBH0026725.1 SIR2 family protein [Pseudoalteromonas sp. SWN29]